VKENRKRGGSEFVTRITSRVDLERARAKGPKRFEQQRTGGPRRLRESRALVPEAARTADKPRLYFPLRGSGLFTRVARDGRI